MSQYRRQPDFSPAPQCYTWSLRHKVMSTLGRLEQRPQTDHNYILVVWTKNSTGPTPNVLHLLQIWHRWWSLSSRVQAISSPSSPYSRPFYAMPFLKTWAGHMWTGCAETAFPPQAPCLNPQDKAGSSSFGRVAHTATPVTWLSVGRCRHAVWGGWGQLGEQHSSPPAGLQFSLDRGTILLPPKTFHLEPADPQHH